MPKFASKLAQNGLQTLEQASDTVEDTAGRFGVISRLIRNDIIPAIRALWDGVVRLYDAVGELFMRWVGEPILGVFSSENFGRINENTKEILARISEIMWGFTK